MTLSKRLLFACIVFFPTLGHSLFIPIKRDNLILFFPMTEGSGTTLKDNSNYRSTGTLKGAVSWVKDPGMMATDVGTRTYASIIDGAVYITETEGVDLETGPIPRMNFQSNPFSIVWVMSMEKYAPNTDIMSYGVGSGGWSIYQAGGISLQFTQFGIDNMGTKWSPPDYLFSHMYGVTRNGSTLKMYVDGKLVETTSMAGNFGNVTPDRDLRYGDSDSGDPGHFLGKLGPLAIWNIVLTDSDMFNLWISQYGRGIMK